MSFRPFTLAGAMLQSAACQAQQPQPRPFHCEPTSNGPAVLTSAKYLAGQYRLKLVATEGPEAGQAVEGSLDLRPYESSLQAVTVEGIRDTAASYVHYGSTDIDLEAVGAVRLGDLESLDPLGPGVLVIERKGTITLRLGSEANRRDVVRFDGGYTALRLGEASRERWTGSWTSGVNIKRSAGYFCGVRVNRR